MKTFTITNEHLVLIRNMVVSYNDFCEFGAPEIDPKRPYGNSSVYRDIAELLGISVNTDTEYFDQEDLDYMDKIHKETATALQIILRTEKFEIGKYEAEKYSIDWRKVD